MESLSSEVLGLILERVSDGNDRKACSEVSTQWLTIEALTRTRVRVLNPDRLPNFLPRFPNLTTLSAPMRISDQALMSVAEFCPNLRTLNLNFIECHSELSEDFGDVGMEAVARGCRRLVNVSLMGRNIGDDGIVALKTYAKDLAVLVLWCCRLITDRSLAAIGEMESISDLEINGCQLITDNGLDLLSSGPASRSLRVLTVFFCKQISDIGALYLRRMPCLEKLDLGRTDELTNVGGVAVSALSNLKKLALTELLGISDETLFAVAKGCRNLVKIYLDGCLGITGQGVVCLASSLPLEKISICNLEYCPDLHSYHIVQIAEQCGSLKLLIVDCILEEGLSPSQRKTLSGFVGLHIDTIDMYIMRLEAA